jgi:hypothetical protein
MSSKNSAHLNFLKKVLAVSAFLVTAGFCDAALAQVRPTILDSGEVNESRNQPVTVDRSKVGSTRASKPSNSSLIILTEPKTADIRIDGKLAGKSVDGRFKTELRTRKRYSIRVSAGPDYEPYSELVTLKPREPAIVEAVLSSRFGTLRIFPAKEGVRILDNEKAIAPDKLTIDKENRIVLDGLSPGSHEITYDLPGYVIYKRSFPVTAGSELIWNFLPERAVVELTVRTDPKTAVYIDGKQVGTTPADGSLKQAVELGKHELKLVKEDFEEYSTTLTFEYGKPLPLEKKLVPLPTSAEFSDDFDVAKPALWTMPSSGVSFVGGRLQFENAKSLCMPTNIRYRDFEMNFHLKLANAAGAAWAVRIKDSNNFYLFYLSGPEGLFPNRFNTYVVHNNEFDPAKPTLSNAIIARVVAGGQYEIHISAKGNLIDHQITSAETGKPENLGSFQDPNSTFLLGGIGFRTVGREKFSIDELVVKPR